jgi:hypothetical protein
VELILYSKVAIWLAVSGFNTVRNKGRSVDSDQPKGLAKLFPGADYFLLLAILCAIISVYSKTIWDMGKEKIEQILFSASPEPFLGLMLVGFAIFLFFYQLSKATSQPVNVPINVAAFKSFRLMALYFLVIGLECTFGLPVWLFLATVTYFIYFSPLVSELNKSEEFKKSQRKTT